MQGNFNTTGWELWEDNRQWKRALLIDPCRFLDECFYGSGQQLLRQHAQQHSDGKCHIAFIRWGGSTGRSCSRHVRKTCAWTGGQYDALRGFTCNRETLLNRLETTGGRASYRSWKF